MELKSDIVVFKLRAIANVYRSMLVDAVTTNFSQDVGIQEQRKQTFV